MQIYFLKIRWRITHSNPDSFLDGITRREVIKIAKSKGIKVIERKIKPEEMKILLVVF